MVLGSLVRSFFYCLCMPDAFLLADDPNRVITVSAQWGKTGADTTISYTNCKAVGNGSFGVVFAAKMSPVKHEDGSEEPESDIAIKKVLQDKRFKVCFDQLGVKFTYAG